MKAVAYYRVSTDTQEYNRQRQDVIDECKRRKLNIQEEFGEKQSGKNREREVLSEMLNYLDNSSDIDYVVIHELSRLGRTRQVVETIEYLHERNIGLITLKENLTTLKEDKTIDKSSNLIVELLTSINSYELDTTKYRSKSGIRQSRLAGNAAGSHNHPYGYKKEGKLLVIDDEEAEIIRTIFNLYLEGNGTKLIANYLNNHNIPTRTQKIIDLGLNKKEYKYKLEWVDGTIYSILKHEIYIGKRKHAIRKVDGFKKKFEYEYFEQPQLQIIEKNTFEEVQRRLTNNVSKSNEHKKKFNYLLDRKKIECGVCKRNYYAHKRSSGKDNRYICLSKRYKRKNDLENNICKNVGISIDKMNRLVQAVILDKYSDILIDNLTDTSLKQEIETIERYIENSKLDLEKAYNKELKLVDLYTDDNISEKSYIISRKKIEDKKEQINNRIRLNTERLNNIKIVFENSINLKNIKYNFNRKNEQLPTNIVNQIINKIRVTEISLAPKRFQDIYNQTKNYDIKFKGRNDKVILTTIISGITELHYLISQREDWVFDFQDNSYKLPYAMGFDGMRVRLPISK